VRMLRRLSYALRMGLRFYLFQLLLRYYWVQWILPFEAVNLVFAFLSMYFIGVAAGAGNSIYAEYGGFVNFLLTGLVANTILKSSLGSAVHATEFLVRGRIGGATGQALSTYDYCLILGIPVAAPILASIADDFSEAAAFAAIYLLVGMIFHYTFPADPLTAVAAVALGSLSLFGISLIAAAFMIRFNTWRGGVNPILWAINTLSNVFAGIYFPVEVIPAGIRWVSWLLPQTYTLSLLRAAARGAPQGEILWNAAVLVAAAAVLLPLGAYWYRRELEGLRRHPPIV